MKRLWLSLLLGLMLALPAGQALVVAAPDAGSGGTKPKFTDIFHNDSCVKIALPFVGNDKCVNNNAANGGAIITYLKTILQFLTMSVGVVIILMLSLGGIQYIVSAGDPARIKGAKNRIQWAVIALLMFLMMYAFLSFVLPGGIFG